MIEVHGDLWVYPAAVKVITTNGTIKRNGEAVMGRGCAKQAADRYPHLPLRLAWNIEHFGNHVHSLGMFDGDSWWLFNFPVKHNWWERADLELIARSCQELRDDMPMFVDEDEVVLIPRPGVGNGKLDWVDVKPILEELLPEDRWKVISP